MFVALVCFVAVVLWNATECPLDFPSLSVNLLLSLSLTRPPKLSMKMCLIQSNVPTHATVNLVPYLCSYTICNKSWRDSARLRNIAASLSATNLAV